MRGVTEVRLTQCADGGQRPRLKHVRLGGQRHVLEAVADGEVPHTVCVARVAPLATDVRTVLVWGRPAVEGVDVVDGAVEIASVLAGFVAGIDLALKI